ncbi:hypothetical protein [Zobellia laminariae]|uniref:hypothetical protein n=1 Tax=Zobellia laminariae TaxID=248906 RepID=UPI0026F41678|nr:hypothetical protein [Zobellia laminariae]WKX77501.1 hypothetical protein Q5W13_05500 [Zobellia laminariae]
MESHPDIKQFQFVQEDRAKYYIKLVTENRLKSEEIIINHFKTFLGTDASIEIVYVEEIKQLASGKRRLIINNYQKGN